MDTVLIAEGHGSGRGGLLYRIGKGSGCHGEAGAPQQAAPDDRHREPSGCGGICQRDRIRDGRRPDGSSQGQGRGTFSGAERWHRGPAQSGRSDAQRSAVRCPRHRDPQARRRIGDAHRHQVQRRCRRTPAGGSCGQHRRDHPPPEGAGCVRLLRRYGRRVPAQEQPDRPHCTGAGQRGQRCFAAGEKAVRRRGAAGYGSIRAPVWTATTCRWLRALFCTRSSPSAQHSRHNPAFGPEPQFDIYRRDKNAER